MTPIFILIRGNSGSGKTVLANCLQNHFGYQRCLLLHEDLLRLDILHVKEKKTAPTASLIELMIEWGKQYYPVIILEGILPKRIYGTTLTKIIHEFGAGAFVYYLDISFAQTVKNNEEKEIPFPLETLEKWWVEQDTLGEKEHKLTSATVKELAEQILTDIADYENKKGD
ncbi:zeta toxin family protein [Lactobacillus kimbladii]|uniref:zeta toxin family protein n=1 Tax=Lactobacillus kimbladii TaxID=1218506 RepID=UPI0016500C72|nr:zeta toxin family protein [Lactobacillus kimbladii]MBC6342655.1 zeta toxin family protein [Lactobacillus kimbladii]